MIKILTDCNNERHCSRAEHFTFAASSTISIFVVVHRASSCCCRRRHFARVILVGGEFAYRSYCCRLLEQRSSHSSQWLLVDVSRARRDFSLFSSLFSDGSHQNPVDLPVRSNKRVSAPQIPKPFFCVDRNAPRVVF
jgi:hypothetical protein